MHVQQCTFANFSSRSRLNKSRREHARAKTRQIKVAAVPHRSTRGAGCLTTIPCVVCSCSKSKKCKNNRQLKPRWEQGWLLLGWRAHTHLWRYLSIDCATSQIHIEHLSYQIRDAQHVREWAEAQRVERIKARFQECVRAEFWVQARLTTTFVSSHYTSMRAANPEASRGGGCGQSCSRGPGRGWAARSSCC